MKVVETYEVERKEVKIMIIFIHTHTFTFTYIIQLFDWVPIPQHYTPSIFIHYEILQSLKNSRMLQRCFSIWTLGSIYSRGEQTQHIEISNLLYFIYY